MFSGLSFQIKCPLPLARCPEVPWAGLPSSLASDRLSIEHDFFLWAFESLPGPWISWLTCSQWGCPYLHGFPCGLWERQFYSTGHGPGVWQILSLTHNSEQISSPPCPYSVRNELQTQCGENTERPWSLWAWRGNVAWGMEMESSKEQEGSVQFSSGWPTLVALYARPFAGFQGHREDSCLQFHGL